MSCARVFSKKQPLSATNLVSIELGNATRIPDVSTSNEQLQTTNDSDYEGQQPDQNANTAVGLEVRLNRSLIKAMFILSNCPGSNFIIPHKGCQKSEVIYFPILFG